MEEENKTLGLQMKSDFTKRVKDIEDSLTVYTKETGQFFSSVKDEVGKYKICLWIIRYSRQTLYNKNLSTYINFTN